MPRNTIPQGRLRGVDHDIATLDMGGHLFFCREDLPDEVAYLAVQAIDARKAAIDRLFPPPHSALTSPVDMHELAISTPIPLHRGAEAYYREHGHL
jgi:hypothetical protein